MHFNQSFFYPALVLHLAISSVFAAPPAPPIVASPDTILIHPKNTVLINVLANDSTQTGELDPASLSIENPPTQGTATIQNGAILYSHTGPGNSADTFVYRVNDTQGHSTTANVSIQFSRSLRLPNVSFAVPSDPPSNAAYQFVEAFPGLQLNQPVCLAHPPQASKQLFVLEKTGVVKRIPDVTAKIPSATSFLDLKTLLPSRGETLATDSEQGVLGLAFHPKFSENGFFYLFYSVKKADAKSYERISRFSVNHSVPSQADPDSELVLIEQLDRATNHQGGCLAFGPDGYLYISLGDEGGQNDQYNNAQSIHQNFFSGILRIDVDRRSTNLEPNPHPSIPLREGKASFAIPNDNPFIHHSQGGSWDGTFNGVPIDNLASVRTEFWATGFRNPWRMSFDSKTGELWVGDVGGNKIEEINIAQTGGNYGWPYKEGHGDGVKPTKASETGFRSIPPIAEYKHGNGPDEGNSVTGGVVVRGGPLPELEGAYLYADFLSGNVWCLRRDGQKPPQIERLFGKSGISAFGTDPATGAILAADFTGNRILKLAAAKTGSTFPQKLSETQLFVQTQTLVPNRGLIPYAINHPVWNDGAKSRHWFGYYATEDGQKIKIEWTPNGSWPTPLGMLWVQHLDIEMERGNPESTRRLETRLLVRNNTGAYGVSYRWNQEQTDATLVAELGEDTTLQIKNGADLVQQTWHYPGQAECMVCHSPQNGNVLSFSTRQMNCNSPAPGFTQNQIDLFFRDGFFKVTQPKANTPPPPPNPKASDMPRFSGINDSSSTLEDQARSYLAVNCSICHRPGGMSPTAWDVRPEIAIDQTGLLNGAVLNNGGDPAQKVLIPADPVHSLILTRMTASNGFTRMPLVGTRQTDEAGVKLLKAWIESLR